MPLAPLKQVLLVGLTIIAASGAAMAQRVGVNSAVNPAANGTPPGAPTHQLIIGQEVVHNEHIVTSANGQTQILFLDGSAMTVAPGSDLTIDDFVYDPKTQKGELAVSVTTGVFRFVGGKISKSNPVTFYTPTGTVSVRGGILLLSVAPGGKLDTALLYGQGVTVTANCSGAAKANSSCPSQTVTRVGFGVSVSGPGASPSTPAPASPDLIASTLAQFNGPTTGTNSNMANPPTETSVANSGISNIVSGNVTASVQQATANNPTPRPVTMPAVVPTVVPATVQSNLNSVSSQVDPQIVQSAQNPTPPGTPINPPAAPAPPAPPAPPQTVVVTISGAFKSTGSPPTVAGFNDPTNNGVYNGTITYPAGPTLQNGIASGIAINGTSGTLGPLTPGQTTAVTFQGSNGLIETGTATMTPDGNFFYSNLSGNSPGTGGPIRGFIMGGLPVSQAFYAGNLPAQILAFQLQPDGALANGAQAQTIPFLPSNYGGTMPNAVVSPLYVTTNANSPFGAGGTNQPLPKILQASLAINGQGSNQTSALAIATGEFFTFTGPTLPGGPANGSVVAAGPVRGTVMLNATSPAVHIGSGLASVSDGNGNSLFGGNTLSGFVVDQNQFPFGGSTYVPATASAGQFGQTTASYAFNQPALTTALPTGVGTNRTSLNEQGFFGGLMSFTGNLSTPGNPYVLAGTNTVTSNVNNNRVAAMFTGFDPFTPAQSNISSMVLQFGNVTPNSNSSRGTFVDNNIYAATDSAENASSINGNQLTLPPNSTSTTPSPSIAMVTSGTVQGAADGLFQAAGATPCSCQFLQWGYWTGQLQSTPSQGLMTNRTDRAFINTWVAGQPTVTMPTSGVGTFNGAAIGTVFNNGATYLAAGQFNNTYNFGAHTGTVSISNFDGRNFAGTVTGPGNTYTGSLTGVNLTGNTAGTFFGPNAVETGGNFSVQSTAGPRYLASGIFAGR